MSTKTWIILAAVVVAITAVGIGWAGYSSGTSVEVTAAVRGEIRAFVDERGMTRLPETYLVTMPYPGRIEPITLTEGDPVKKGDAARPVARIVRADLELNVQEAQAVVGRLDAAIAENLNNKLEDLIHRQSVAMWQSMQKTVEAAANRIEAGREKQKFAANNHVRIRDLFDKGTVTQEELERAQLQQVESNVDLRQDELVHAITVFMEAATRLLPDTVKQYISNKDLKDAVLNKEKAEATTRLEKVELDRKRGTLASPVDGVVLNRRVSDERFLPAGEPLVEIGRLEDLQVEADVLSLDVVEAKVGDPVEIYGPAIGRSVRGQPDRHFARGTVEKIYPAGFTKVSSLGVEQQRVKVIVRIDPEDLRWLRGEQSLGVGYRVRVRIITQSKPDALIVPRSALFRGTGGGWELYVVRNGRARTQPVATGIFNDRHVEITAGLDEGDLVIRTPESSLENGERVKAVRRDSEAGSGETTAHGGPKPGDATGGSE
jgi:HlyD family secretion protein